MKARLNSFSCLSLIFAVCIVSSVTTATKVMAQTYNRGPDRIAVIDVKYILENHVRFKASMESLKQRFEAVSKQLNADREQIINMSKRLNDLNPNTPDYNQLEEQITRAKADFAVQAERQKKEFRNNEGHILWNVYQEISMETQAYCQTNGIGLVIQFNGEKVDGDKPQEVFGAITRPIVYNAPQWDITAPILHKLNQGATAARTGGLKPGVPPRTR